MTDVRNRLLRDANQNARPDWQQQPLWLRVFQHAQWRDLYVQSAILPGVDVAMLLGHCFGWASFRHATCFAFAAIVDELTLTAGVPGGDL